VHRSALYYQHKDDEVDIWLINLIRDIWLQYPFYGYRKIKIVLKIENNLEVNNKRVLRLMQIAGIQAIYPKPHLSKANPAHRKFSYLLRDIKITRANQVWMVDISAPQQAAWEMGVGLPQPPICRNWLQTAVSGCG
jgi:putative transposase